MSQEEKEPAANAEKEVAEYRDQMLRARAEMENVKKRLERDSAEAVRFANERLLAEILIIVDNFDHAMMSLAEGHDPDRVRQGLKIAQDELHRILERHGVETVKAVGSPFDPRFHEAVGVTETDKTEDGTVTEEIQKGYLLNGRLIRPSRVKVAKKSP